MGWQHEQKPTVGKQPLSKGTLMNPCKAISPFHSEVRFDSQVFTGQFTQVGHIRECYRGSGQVEIHHWQRLACNHESLVVVVKRVCATCVGSSRDGEADQQIVQDQRVSIINEVGLYCLLFRNVDIPPYILKMFTAFEATREIWLVLEHADGGDLLSMVTRHKKKGSVIPVPQSMLWMGQLLQAVGFLHKCFIGHRDISLDNVLLCRGDVRLMDFEQAVKTHSATGELLRYCCTVGKDYYRGPESVVPLEKIVEVKTPPDAHPGKLAFARTVSEEYFCDVMLPSTAVRGQNCLAEVVGYAAAPNDVFSCGVCLFIMATGGPPWQQASLKDSHFIWTNKHGIPKLLKEWKQQLPLPMEDLLSSMLKANPMARASVEACLAYPCLMASNQEETLCSVASGSSGSAAISNSSTCVQPTTNLDAGFDSPEPELDTDQRSSIGASFYAEPEVTRNAIMPLSGLVDEESPSAMHFFEDTEHLFKHDDLQVVTIEEPSDAPKMILALERQLKKRLWLSTPVAKVGLGLTDYTSALATASKSELQVVIDGIPFASRQKLLNELQMVQATVPVDAFNEDEMAPKIPFGTSLRATPIFHVSSTTSAGLCNYLLGFLGTVNGAWISEVDHEHFSIKVEINGDIGKCHLAICISTADDEQHTVEFKRLNGDGIVCHQLCHQAFDYLSSWVSAVGKPVGVCYDSSVNPPRVRSASCSAIGTRQIVSAVNPGFLVDPGIKGLLKQKKQNLINSTRQRHELIVRRPSAPGFNRYSQRTGDGSVIRHVIRKH